MQIAGRRTQRAQFGQRARDQELGAGELRVVREVGEAGALHHLVESEGGFVVALLEVELLALDDEHAQALAGSGLRRQQALGSKRLEIAAERHRVRASGRAARRRCARRCARRRGGHRRLLGGCTRGDQQGQGQGQGANLCAICDHPASLILPGGAHGSRCARECARRTLPRHRRRSPRRRPIRRRA